MPHHKRCIRFMLGLLAAGFLAGVGPDSQLGPGGRWSRTIYAAAGMGSETLGLVSVLCPDGLEQRGGVWTKRPAWYGSARQIPLPQSWVGAKFFCLNKVVSNRRGWRLPSIMELASLIDPSRAYRGEPAVGASLCGHPVSQLLVGDSRILRGCFERISCELHRRQRERGSQDRPPPVLVCVRGGMNAKVY